MTTPSTFTAAFRRLFWIILYVASPAVPLAVYFAGNWSAILQSWSLSMVFGIAAYIWFLNQFVVAARPAYWDRIFGLDRMYRFHGTMAIAAVVAALAHLVLKRLTFPVLTLQQAFGALAAFLFVTVTVATLVFMVEGRLSRLKPLARLRTAAVERWRWQYQTLKLFHNLVAPAALLLLVHVLLAFSTLESFARISVMALWFVGAGSFYAWHKVIRPRAVARTPFRVVGVAAENSVVTRIDLQVPEGRSFRHRAGQFAYFRFLDSTPGPEEHPFTISSAPNGTTISITAKNLGDFSGELIAVQPKAAVAVDGPYGIFRVDRLPEDQPVVFVAGGIGITPFLAMLNDEKATGDRRVHLIWSVRHEDELFELDHLQELIGARSGGLSIDVHVTGADASPKDSPFQWRTGRVSVDSLHHQISLHEHPAYFLCGPTPMMESLIKGLRANGVAGSRIHFEAFAM